MGVRSPVETSRILPNKTHLYNRDLSNLLAKIQSYFTAMPLSDLPVEILLEIADRLDDAGVNALARTNGQVYSVVNEYLYRRDFTKPQSRSLAWAAEKGVRGTIQRAVHAGRYFDPIPESFHTALQIAADQGHVYLVKLLLEVNGINPNFGGGSFKLLAAPLLLATNRGYSAIVELLLAAVNVDPNVTDQYSTTPLYEACNKGHVSIVKQLLARGDVDINARVRAGTPLIVACRSRHIEIINLLLAKDGIDVNLYGNTSGNTPLIMAIQTGLVEVVESLLARDDIDPNIINCFGKQALGYAAYYGNVEILKLLLNHPGIDLNFVGAYGYTALMLVVKCFGRAALGQLKQADYRSRLESAKLLLEREDIDINLRDNNGWTVLFWACHVNCSALVDLLLEKDHIDPNPRELNSGRTPLAHVCHFGGSVAIVNLLLSRHDTNLNAVDNNGVSIFADFTNRRHRVNMTSTDRQREDEIESLLHNAGARR
jgi:ankyrin repeat protein